MMKIIILSFFISLIICGTGKAQNDTIYFLKNYNITLKYATSAIDSIIFYNPKYSNTSPTDTMYFIKNKKVINYHSLKTADLDSITFNNPNFITDIDGNIYRVIVIGNQVWMAENLKTSKLNDGTVIPQIKDNNNWINATSPAFCYYNNDSLSYSPSFGALYNWYTVNTNKLCPIGWHVPTDDDFKQLEIALGMPANIVEFLSWRGSDEGSKLAGNAALWNDGYLDSDPNFGKSGFSALPSGFRASSTGGFLRKNEGTYFWTTTYYDIDKYFTRYLYYTYSEIARTSAPKGTGLPIRCVRN